MKALIQKMVEAIGPAGYEKPVRELIRKEILPHKGEVDALGNLIVRIGKKEKNGKRVMLAAHMDEIGIMATHVDENGFVRFSTLGGVGHMTLIGGRVRFLNGIEGVISTERKDKADQLSMMEHMYLDVGASSPKDCPVKVGDVAGFQRSFLDMGNRLVAKSMDDRIGVVVLIETFKGSQKDSKRNLLCVLHTGRGWIAWCDNCSLCHWPRGRYFSGCHLDWRYSKNKENGCRSG